MKLKTSVGAVSVALLPLLLAYSMYADPLRCTDLQVTQVMGTQASLSWTASIPFGTNVLTELDIRMSTNLITTLNFPDQTRCELLTDPGVAGTVQAATIAGLRTNTTYYFALKYRDNGGWSTMSNLKSAATLNVPTTTLIIVSWDPAPGTNASGYYIYYGPASGYYTNIVSVGNVVSYTFTNLANGTTCFIALTAHDANGNETDFSNEVISAP